MPLPTVDHMPVPVVEPVLDPLPQSVPESMPQPVLDPVPLFDPVPVPLLEPMPLTLPESISKPLLEPIPQTDLPFETLATAAFHGERVAARRLAARTQITEAQALTQVLTQAASLSGATGLAALVDARQQVRNIDADRRAARRLQQADQLAQRQATLVPPQDRWRGWFDGSAHPNPGRIGIGALLCGPAGQRIEISRRAGHGNSGEAEYLALIALLEAAADAGARDLLLYGDSQVVVNDVNSDGQGKRATGLEPYRARVLVLMATVATTGLHWVPRHRNGDADRLSQQAIESAPADQA